MHRQIECIARVMHTQPIHNSIMKSITHLEDRQSEALCGGHWRSYTSIKISSTGVRQSNDAGNFSLAFLGLANAQSIQGNASGVSTRIY
jgi:hypothetical protein